MEAWTQLQNFAQDEHQRVWINEELQRNPPVAGQDPFEWLLWRRKIAEGMTEVEAWESLLHGQHVSKPATSVREQQRVNEGIMLNGASASITAQQGYGNPTYVAPQAMYPPQPLTAYAGTAIAPSALHSVQSAETAVPQYNYVQTNDILPLPTVPISFDDDMEDGAGSPVGDGSDTGSRSRDTSPGSSRSSSGAVVDDDDIDELEEDIKPTIIGLPIASPSVPLLPASPTTSRKSPFDLTPPQSSPRPLGGRTARVTPRPAADWSKLFPAYPNSPYAKNLALLEQHKRPRRDSSSIDPAPPRVAKKPLLPVSSTALSGTSSQPQTIVPPPIDMALIRTLITPQRLKVDKPKSLWRYLRTQNDGDDPPKFEPTPAELREIVGAIYINAPPDYKQGMADNELYAEQIGRWLKQMSKNTAFWEMAIAPLIMLLASTDIAVDVIKDMGIGKYISQANRKATELNLANASGITTAFERWKDHCTNKLLPIGRTLATDTSEYEKDVKKEKPSGKPVQAGSQSKVKSEPIDKKPIISSSSASGASSKTPAPARSAASGSSSLSGTKRAVPSIPSTASSASASGSMSFFSGNPASAPAAKRAKVLPSFKKGVPGSSAPSTATSGALPPASATTSLLAATLARVNAAASQAPLSSAAISPVPPPTRPIASAAVTREPAVKLNKKGHTVRFKDDVGSGLLVEKKIFEEEPWELEKPFWLLNEDGSEVAHGSNPHDLDISEGMTMKKEMAEHRDQVADHLIEWYTPQPYVDTPLPPPTPDTIDQEHRERGILAVAGGTAPDESSVRVVPPDASKHFRLPDALAAAPVPVQQTVSQLLSNLSSIGTLGNIGFGLQPPAPGHAAAHVPQPAAIAPAPAHNYYGQAPSAYQGQGGYAGQYGGYQPQQQAPYSQHGQHQQQPWQAGPPGGGYDGGQNGGGFGGQSDQGWGGGGASRGGAWAGAGGGGEYDRGPGNNGHNRHGTGGGAGAGGGRGGRGGGQSGGGGYGWKTRPCKYFASGNCKQGDHCAFMH